MEKLPTNSPRLARRWPRFTIWGLLWTTTIIACVFPTAWFAWFLLLNASTSWGSHAFLGTAVALALSGAVAISSDGARRACCSGFAAVGLAYFLVVPCSIAVNSARYTVFHPDHLATTKCNRWVYRELAVPALLDRRARGVTFWTGEEDFVQVAHLLWTLPFGTGGGLLSLALWAAFGRAPRKEATHERP